MKEWIPSELHNGGGYWGYRSAADAEMDYENELSGRKDNETEALVGWISFWVMITAIVVLIIVAGSWQTAV